MSPASNLEAQADLLDVELSRTLHIGQPVEALAIAGSNDLAALGTKDGRVGVFDLRIDAAPRWVAKQRGRLSAVAFNRAGSTLASGGDDGIVKVVRLSDGRVSDLRGLRRRVLALAFSADGHLLAAAGEDRDVMVWECSSGAELYRLPLERHKAVVFLSFNPSRNTLLAIDEGGAISEWDPKNRSQLRQLQASDTTIYSAAANFSGSHLVLGTESSGLRKGIKGATGSLQERVRTTDPAEPTIDAHRDVLFGRSNIGGPDIQASELFRESSIKVYDSSTLAVVKALDGINGLVRSVAISPDSQYVAVARQKISDSFLSVYDIRRATEVVSLPAPRDEQAVAFSADGRWLIGASSDGTVSVFATRGIQRQGEVGDLIGMKFSVTSSQGTALIAPRRPVVVAVADLEGEAAQAGTAQSISDMLRTRIAQNSNVRLVDTARIKQIIEQQNFQYSGRVDAAAAVRLGQILGAQKLVLGSVTKLGAAMSIHTEVVDVETGRVDGACEVLCRPCSLEDLPEAVARLASALVAGAP